MVLGTKIRKFLHLPGLHIESEREKCISCKKCDIACPMGLDVNHMAIHGNLDHTECIQCGACVDSCPKSVLSYRIRYKEKSK